MSSSNEKASIYEFALFGKLPGAGDFVSRRMPYRMQQFWDQWCAAGVEQLKETSPVGGWAIWRSMPFWAFLIPTQQGIPFAQLGVIAPSCDRVGRVFPLLATLAIQDSQVKAVLPRAANIALAWANVTAHSQHGRVNVDAFDAMLSDALAQCMQQEVVAVDSEATLPPGASPSTLPWPDLHVTFDIYAAESFWWSVPPANTGFRAKTHRGALTASLFTSLTM
jgi:type VI secretion system protein ImpM